MGEGIEVEDREDHEREDRKRDDDDLHISTDGKIVYLSVAAFATTGVTGTKANDGHPRYPLTAFWVHLHLQHNVGW